MLQRAASNAYSWWWASHVRTKQSKWLEQNLQDMEEKVNSMLKIIDEDGDSFAKRAEMYYRKRPELMNFVEDSYRAYRALAERYDHMSRELQNANRTIATVYPEQVQLAMDDEEEENFLGKLTPSDNQHAKTLKPNTKPTIANIPRIPKKEFKPLPTFIKRRGQLKRTGSSARGIPSSGLNKAEALEEIDKLQKQTLALQTEKEFVKSLYESRLSKYWEIENQITEIQGKVCSLQDEFGIGTVIEDNEARKLMAATALKSCQQTLIQLQEKQEQSVQEARTEYRRIKEAHERFNSLRNVFIQKETNGHMLNEEDESASAGPEVKQLEQVVDSLERERHDLEALKEKIRENIEVNSNASLTVTELADKIHELVDKVISLENVVTSQIALVNRLRSETDELQGNIRSLEEDKETLTEDSDKKSNKLRELEEELQRVKNLNQSFEDGNRHLQTHFTEATCNLDHLSDKLQNVKPDEEGENLGLFQETKVNDAKPGKEFEEQEDMPAPEPEAEERKDEVQDLSNSVNAEKEENFALQSHPSTSIDILHEDRQKPKRQKKDERQESSETVDSDLDTGPHYLATEEEDQPNWRQLFSNGLEDREKLLVEEYTSILRNFNEVKKKLSEVEKKNRDGLFELAMQIRELRTANTLKDEEIQSLRQKLSSVHPNSDETPDTTSTENRQSKLAEPQESITKEAIPQYRNISSLNSYQKPLYVLLDEQNIKSTRKYEEWARERSMKSTTGMIPVEEPCAISTIEEKLRTDIDDLLEENLEFWLRFSTSFHQIQKFQTSIQDLQAELSKLKEAKKQGLTSHQSLKSDARPIYKHLREIQTELKLWFEHNAVLKDELQTRFSSLCNIEEKISRLEESELSDYQAAKFQGEVQNMKQENNKVADELQAGLNRMKGLQVVIERTLAKMDEDFGISESKNQQSMRQSSGRSRIPLQSFLFGVKLKKQKQSIFSCMNPALQKQYSDLTSGIPKPK